MRKEDYKNAFQMVEMKCDMKERIIAGCLNQHYKKRINNGTRRLIAAACCILLCFGANTLTTYAFGYNLVSKFYRLIQTDTNNRVEINMSDRRETSKDIKVTTPPDIIDKDLYSFLDKNNMTNLIVPQNLTKEWTIVDSNHKKAGISTDLKSSISFTISNGTDQIKAFIDAGISDKSAYQVGVDYVETKTINKIEFLIVHLKQNMTYKMYLQEFEAAMLPIMQISAEKFHKTRTYIELGSEEQYQKFIKNGSFIDFSAGGYDYSYALSKGINVDDFLKSLALN